MGFEAITTKRTHRVYHRAATFADLANDSDNGFRELESRVVVVEPELQILRNRLKRKSRYVKGLLFLKTGPSLRFSQFLTTAENEKGLSCSEAHSDQCIFALGCCVLGHKWHERCA